MKRRAVKVATVSHKPWGGVDSEEGTERLMQDAERFLTRASRMGAELVAFPECYPQLKVDDPSHHAEPTEGGTLLRVQELARKLGLYVVWPRLEYDLRRGLRNTAVVVGRDGEVVGRYDKVFPTVGEVERGVVPGEEVGCFDLDFGKLGVLICFDMNFEEVKGKLAEAGPDVVVFPSMYRGGLQAQALAFELGAFVVTAVSSELGVVVDRCGRVLKESTYESLAVAPINTNSVALHMDFNWDKMDQMLEKHGRELTFDYHTREAYFIIESSGSEDVGKVVEEFELETARDYFERSRSERRRAIEKWGRRS